MSACYTFRLPDASKKHWLQQQLLARANSNQQPQQQQQQSGSSKSGGSAGDAVAGSRAAQGLGFGNQLRYPADDDDEDELEWDAGAPWHPWAQHRDPIKALELDIVWQDRQIAQGIEQPDSSAAAAAAAGFGDSWALSPAGSTAVASAAGMSRMFGDAGSADHWLLHVVQHGFSSSPIRQGRLGMRSADRHRRHVSVAAAGTVCASRRCKRYVQCAVLLV
jgi:hypothetical protein